MIIVEGYVLGKGVLVTVLGASEGYSLHIPDNWTVQAIENHLKELEAFAN